MAYRRFKLPEIGFTPATVATLATVRADEPQSVATVASVAAPNPISEPQNLESVATTVAGSKPDFGPVVPAAYRAAFDNLCASCPAGVPLERWQRAVADAERFLAEWGEAAERLGWSARDLFDLHETVPLSRMDRMGMLWLLKGQRVILLTEHAARFERGLTFYKPPRARATP